MIFDKKEFTGLKVTANETVTVLDYYGKGELVALSLTADTPYADMKAYLDEQLKSPTMKAYTVWRLYRTTDGLLKCRRYDTTENVYTTVIEPKQPIPFEGHFVVEVTSPVDATITYGIYYYKEE